MGALIKNGFFDEVGVPVQRTAQHGLLGLYKTPRRIECNLLRPFGLVQRGDYITLVTSGFNHADLAHLFVSCLTFWPLALDSNGKSGRRHSPCSAPLVY